MGKGEHLKRQWSRTARGRRKPGEMNKLEAAYAQHLEALRVAGEIEWWVYEAVTLKLAKDTRYTPDFVVMDKTFHIIVDETKGFLQDDAWVKLKVAAEKFPFRFRLVRQVAKKNGGGWDIKEVGE